MKAQDQNYVSADADFVAASSKNVSPDLKIQALD
jgi:hypothetical protein